MLRAHRFRVEWARTLPLAEVGCARGGSKGFPVSRVVMMVIVMMILIKAEIGMVGTVSLGNVGRSRTNPQLPPCACVKAVSCEMAANEEREVGDRKVKEPEGWGR